MNLLTLSELQSKLGNLKSDILKHPKANQRIRKSLLNLLEECTAAGKYIIEPVERTSLQWIAREIGDIIFRGVWLFYCDASNPSISVSHRALSCNQSFPPESSRNGGRAVGISENLAW
jgi:hypothetical protein